MNTPMQHTPALRPAANVATNALGFPMGTPVAASKPSTFGLPDIWRILTKYRWLILASLVVGIAAAIATVMMTAPQYRATATLEINQDTVKMIDPSGKMQTTPMTDAQSLETHYGMLRSAALAERVARDLNLTQDPAFANQASPPQSRLEQATAGLTAGFTVTPVPSSRLVQISYRSPSPEMAARVPNAFAENYMQSVLERRYGASEYAREFLQRRIAEVRARLEQNERALVAYAQQEGIVQLGTSSPTETDAQAAQTLDSARLQAANMELSAAQNARVAAEQRYRQAAAGQPTTEMLASNTVQQIRSQLAELRAQYQTKSNMMRPDHPEMADLRANIAGLEESLQGEGTNVLGALRSEYQAAVGREREIAGRVNELRGAVLNLQGRSIQYNILQRNVDTDRSTYQALLQRYNDIGVAGGVGENLVSIVDPARVPGGPFEPNPVRSTVIGALIGLLAGLAAAFALEFLTYTIRSQEDLESKLEIPPLGVIPNQKNAAVAEVLENPRSPIMEAYASVRSAIQFATAQGAPSTLLVTSSGPAEGKTTTAIALARNFARLGYNTLLLDADLRNPSFTMEEGDSPGFSGLLTGAAKLEDVIRPTSISGLSLLEAGMVPPNPADLLSDPALAEILRKLSGMFDIVIIDGPPVLGLADAPLLSAVSDRTLVVFRSRQDQAVRGPEHDQPVARGRRPHRRRRDHQVRRQDLRLWLWLRLWLRLWRQGREGPRALHPARADRSEKRARQGSFRRDGAQSRLTAVRATSSRWRVRQEACQGCVPRRASPTPSLSKDVADDLGEGVGAVALAAVFERRVHLEHQAALAKRFRDWQGFDLHVGERRLAIDFRAGTRKRAQARGGGGLQYAVAKALIFRRVGVDIGIEFVEGAGDVPGRQRHADAGDGAKGLGPDLRIGDAPRPPDRQLFQLQQADRGRDLGHPPVGADPVVQPAKAGLRGPIEGALAVLAMILERPGIFIGIIVAKRDEPTLAAGRDDLVLAEGEGGRVAEAPDRQAVYLCAVRLGAILDDVDAALPGQRHDRRHVRRPAAKMHRDDRLGSGRDRGGDGFGIDVAAVPVDIDEHRDGADQPDAEGRCHESARRDDHFVAGADAEGLQRELERDRSIGQGDGAAVARAGGYRPARIRRPCCRSTG